MDLLQQAAKREAREMPTAEPRPEGLTLIVSRLQSARLGGVLARLRLHLGRLGLYLQLQLRGKGGRMAHGPQCQPLPKRIRQLE